MTLSGRPSLQNAKNGFAEYNSVIAPVAQWIEQRPSKSEVVGSSPAGGAHVQSLISNPAPLCCGGRCL